MGTRSPGKRRWRLYLIVAAALLLLPILLAVSLTPELDVQARPTAQDIQLARKGYRDLQTRRVDELGGSARFDRRTLAGLASLVRDATSIDRMALDLDNNGLRGRASIPLPLGLWLNLEGRTTGSDKGFPEVECRAGWLSPPNFLCRAAIELARQGMIWRGAEVPPLDTIVHHVSVGPDSVFLAMFVPEDSDMIDTFVKVQGDEVNQGAVRQEICRLAEWHGTSVRPLDEVVRKAFSDHRVSDPANNGIRLVALAIHIVGPQARPLAPQAYAQSRDCAAIPGSAHILGRSDLALHWTYSAGLTARFGEDIASDFGEWKELKDSLGSGSGFSFVDLAADRSGVAFARMAMDPGEASSAALLMSRVTGEQLMPSHLLAEAEGMREEDFVARFGSLEADAYRNAVGYIDRSLRKAR